MENNRKYIYFLLAIAGLLILADQMSKFIVMGVPFLGITSKGIRAGEYISAIGDFLQFTYVENPGMAFGISFGVMKIILTLFSLIASVGLIYVLFKFEKKRRAVLWGFMLILAGAFGNFIDRMFYGQWFQGGKLFYGRVVDFILVDIPDISIGNLSYSHWPVFNIADACVTVGVAVLLLNYKHLSDNNEKIENAD